MSTTTEHSELTELDRGRGYVIITAESTSEVLAGTAVIVVAILGLAGLAPIHMMSTGVIALGTAFLLEGAVNLTETWGDVPVGGDTTTKRVSLTNDVSAELLAGVAGGVLGILSADWRCSADSLCLRHPLVWSLPARERPVGRTHA